MSGLPAFTGYDYLLYANLSGGAITVPTLGVNGANQQLETKATRPTRSLAALSDADGDDRQRQRLCHAGSSWFQQPVVAYR